MKETEITVEILDPINIAKEKIKCNINDIESMLKIFNLSGLNCWCKIT